MRIRVSTRALCLVISLCLLWINAQAQLQLGPQRLVNAPAPSLRNRTRLNVGLGTGRPRISFVGKVGGVAFDSVAKPADGVVVNTIRLSYSPSKRDGERLSLIINGQAVSAPIYDWRLVPIAKFANSDSYSCFTLFGELNDAEEQRRVLDREGRVLNYHQDFVNTLLGLRLFQLDNLIINPFSHELPKDGNTYVLGAGESAPNLEANIIGLETFERYRKQNEELFKQGTSYVISDHRRQVTFDLEENKLNLYGEPSYYFWRMDEEARARLISGEAEKQVQAELVAQFEKDTRRNPRFNHRIWLIDQLLAEATKYDQQVGDYRILETLQAKELLTLLLTKGLAQRRALLNQQPPESLESQLVDLRLLASIQSAKEVPELSEKVSKQTAMLRAINPAVWDAGVTVMRYAAFFRYCKQKNPQQYNLFMRQIKHAPALQPPVITPTIMEAPSK